MACVGRETETCKTEEDAHRVPLLFAFVVANYFFFAAFFFAGFFAAFFVAMCLFSLSIRDSLLQHAANAATEDIG